MLGESDAMPIGARVGHLKEVPVAYVICHVDNEPISIFMMDRQNFARFKQAVRINQSPEEAQHFQIGEMSAVALKQADGIICAVGKVKAGEIERHLFESLKS